MLIYIYMYIHVYIYIHMNIDIYICIYRFVHISVHIHVCLYICMCIRTRACAESDRVFKCLSFRVQVPAVVWLHTSFSLFTTSFTTHLMQFSSSMQINVSFFTTHTIWFVWCILPILRISLYLYNSHRFFFSTLHTPSAIPLLLTSCVVPLLRRLIYLYYPHQSLCRYHAHHRPILYYGVATISRLLNIIGLFCRIWSLYRALLQKRPIILRSLLIVATPYSHHSFFLRYTYQSFFTTHINLFLLTTRTIGTPYFTTHTGALDLRIVTIWILDVTYGISGANMPEILEVGIYYVRQRLNVTCGISGTNVPTIP